MTTRQLIALEKTRRERRELEKKHPLRQLFWECTLRCNLSCRHCGSDCRKIATQADMPLDDFLPVLVIVELGAQHLKGECECLMLLTCKILQHYLALAYVIAIVQETGENVVAKAEALINALQQ